MDGKDKNALLIAKAFKDWRPTLLECVSEIGLTEVLAQLAEESAELGQAALKFRRVLDRRNPTPVPEYEARANLQEEMADVLLCMVAAGLDAETVERTIRAKIARWATRLENGGADSD